MTIYWRLKKYEDICPDPERLKGVDRLYLEKCQEVSALTKRMRWIPVAERLPDSGNEVLTYIRHNYAEDGWRAYRVYEYTDHWVGMGNLCEVIAWMPLPEPYIPETLREAGAEAGQDAAAPA